MSSQSSEVAVKDQVNAARNWFFTLLVVNIYDKHKQLY